MKKISKALSIILTAFILMLPFDGFKAHASTEYAYSVGVNFGSSGTTTGDFTQNVLYANTCYGMISGVTSYYNCIPDQAYMKGNNPAGARRMGSRIIFLNSHGSQTSMTFNQNNAGGSYFTGIYYGYDTTERVGIMSTDMSGVDLISFVGCKTGQTTSTNASNLPSRDVQKGATSAVGFTDSIHSRFINGPDWLRKYNDALTNGYTISGAISYATSCYPNSDLGTYAVIYGSSTNRIAYGGTVNGLPNDDNIQLETVNVDISIPSIETTDIVPCEELTDKYTTLFNEIQKIDESFNPEDYSAYINMFSCEDNNGMIVLTYQIGNKIDTNYAYVATVENGKITSITKNFDKKTTIDEANIIQRMEEFTYTATDRDEYIKNLNIDSSDIVSETERYLYDYSTGKLTFVKTLDYEVKEKDGSVIVDNVFNKEL